jgi:3-oxoacyl-(acyl-carrier-protein) synthase
VAVSRVVVTGCGAVSPAGWSAPILLEVVRAGIPLPELTLQAPQPIRPLRVRLVPFPDPKPACLGHPRLRRSGAISQHTVAAALECLGDPSAGRAAQWREGTPRLGIVFCTLAGGVHYSRRFYDETIRDPATASPILFPETVMNAPASHLAAHLELSTINYTTMGDPGCFVLGLALAAGWIEDGRVDGCLVVGAEELDWPVVDGHRLFQPRIVASGGAGALLLERAAGQAGAVPIAAITEPWLYTAKVSRHVAASAMRRQLPAGGAGDLLCDGLQDIPRLDAAEAEAWRDWGGERISPKRFLGEGLTAAAAWQCVVAVEGLRRGLWRSACVSVVGCNQQAIGIRFTSPP